MCASNTAGAAAQMSLRRTPNTHPPQQTTPTPTTLLYHITNLTSTGLGSGHAFLYTS